MTAKINVNLKPCDCDGHIISGGDNVHESTCASTPVLIPCPVKRSVVFTVRLEQEAIAVVWERESGDDSAPHLRGAEGWTRCGKAIPDFGRPRDVPMNDLEAPLCRQCDRLRGVDASYGTAQSIRVTSSISGKTWAESKVTDVEEIGATGVDSGPQDAARYAELLHACRERWALVKALVLGHTDLSTLITGPKALELVAQRNAVFAALCRVRQHELGLIEAVSAVPGGDAGDALFAQTLAFAENALGRYVERVIEQIGVMP